MASEVGVVGLVAGVGGLAELLGGEGMDDAGLEAGGGEGALDDVVIAAGAFDGDQAVVEVVAAMAWRMAAMAAVEGGAVVFDGGGRDEDVAVEVGKHPFGAGLGAVDGDDAEVLGADLLDARVEGAARLLDDVGGAGAGTFAGGAAGHKDCLRKRGETYPKSLGWQPEEEFFFKEPTYQGSGVISTSSYLETTPDSFSFHGGVAVP